MSEYGGNWGPCPRCGSPNIKLVGTRKYRIIGSISLGFGLIGFITSKIVIIQLPNAYFYLFMGIGILYFLYAPSQRGKKFCKDCIFEWK
jgi:hypothetical protein